VIENLLYCSRLADRQTNIFMLIQKVKCQ